MPLGNATETPTVADPQKEKSSRSSSQSSPKASSKSPPKSPQKRQILPQQTIDLLKSQVMELTTDNTTLDQARGTSLQVSNRSTTFDETRRQEGANSGQEDDSPKEDADCTNMPKAKNTTCGTKFPVDQSTKISMKDEARSGLLQQQNKDGATSFVLSTTKSLEKSPSKITNKKLKPNINEVLKKVSTTHNTQVVVDSTILPRQDICMKPLSEYMIKGSFQLSPVTTPSSLQRLYEDNQGGQFQLLFFHQEKMPGKPKVFKYLHVKSLTYAYKDTDGNEYQPYHEPDNTLNNKAFEQSHTCGGCGIAQILKDCPMLMTSIKVPLGSALDSPIAAKSLRAKSSISSAQSSKSPPMLPQKRPILPHSTTKLLKSHVMEFQADNAKLEQARGASLQMPIATQKDAPNMPSKSTTFATHQQLTCGGHSGSGYPNKQSKTLRQPPLTLRNHGITLHFTSNSLIKQNKP